MKFKKYFKAILNEAPGQLDELDYRKNPNAPIAASGVVGSNWLSMKNAAIKKLSTSSRSFR
jgi:hypothetical protein